jgi:cellulose synthase/poly-beta-1,6-N-acetylglucosamine synthase-like glycosyltransferase
MQTRAGDAGRTLAYDGLSLSQPLEDSNPHLNVSGSGRPSYGRATGAARKAIVTYRKPIGSVVSPAHNEANVIGRCLSALLRGADRGELDVVVVCHGCSDDTAAVARTAQHSVRVIELDAASKSAALRAGDEAAIAMPRLYLDADEVLSAAAARRVLERLSAGAVAARPPIRYDSSRSSAPVRSYYRARARIPAVMGSLWRAGVCGLSAAGRARFRAFQIWWATTCGGTASSSQLRLRSSTASQCW